MGPGINGLTTVRAFDAINSFKDQIDLKELARALETDTAGAEGFLDIWKQKFSQVYHLNVR